MQRLILTVGLLFAGAAVAHEGVTNPAVMARMQSMKDSAGALEAIGGMARGSVPFDAARAAEAKATLLDAAIQTPALFEDRETDPKSEALPVIWEEFSRFTDLNDASIAAVQALDTGSAESLGAGLRLIGPACAACHERYRVDE